MATYSQFSSAPSVMVVADQTSTTLQEVVRTFLADRTASSPALIIWSRQRPLEVSSAELATLIRRRAAALLDKGLGPGNRLLLALPTGTGFVATFWAAQLLGVTVVPADVPAGGPTKPPSRFLSLVDACSPDAISCEYEIGKWLRPMVQTSFVEDSDYEFHGTMPSVDPSGAALIQFTSGSTGTPKGCVLSHRAVTCNLGGITQRFQVRPGSVGVSWAPLYHDMGLIGGVAWPMFANITPVLIPPTLFARNPFRWLDAITQFRASITTATNSALLMLTRRALSERTQSLDLSSLAVLLVGAEPIDPNTVRKFLSIYGEVGLDPATIQPAWGMAETTVLTTSHPGGMSTIHVDRSTSHLGRVLVTSPRQQSIEVPSLGRPLPGDSVRVAGTGITSELETTFPSPIGELEVKSTSLLTGYWKEAPCNRWFSTGDVGFIYRGEVFLLARSKDLIIVAGRNISPFEVERLVSAEIGSHPGSVAAFGAPGSGTEGLIVVIEPALREKRENFEELIGRVRNCCRVELGVVPRDVVIARRRALPRTSSGKLIRTAARSMYLAGKFADREGPSQ